MPDNRQPGQVQPATVTPPGEKAMDALLLGLGSIAALISVAIFSSVILGVQWSVTGELVPLSTRLTAGSGTAGAAALAFAALRATR
jgi:hypothetical protein